MSGNNETLDIQSDLLATLLSDEAYWPVEPKDLSETGLTHSFVESQILKQMHVAGTSSGRKVAEWLGLPFSIIEEMLAGLRTRQLIVHSSSAPFNDYYYALTEKGGNTAQFANRACSYLGPLPVPLMDYIISVDAQSITAESPRRDELEAAFEGITIDSSLLELLGPAVNSGAGMFLYGAPGNGKSTLANRITRCFGQEIWIPHAIIEGGQIIKLFDPSYHEPVHGGQQSLLRTRASDARWIKIKRPTVVVGGELTMDSLEIRHDQRTNVSEAPLQLKSNGGCFLIDDFGRQQVAPAALLNRWIIPLENRHDFLTLGTGQKIRVPFDQLIIFSTNLDPEKIVDEAFLRRLPYKIKVEDPTVEEFHKLFIMYAGTFGCKYRENAVDHLIETQYRRTGRKMRRCHPRDLMKQIRSYCAYQSIPIEMLPEYFDRVSVSYFTQV